MEPKEETCNANTKRTIKRKVPQDYDPHETHKKVSRREKKRPTAINTYKEEHFKCDNCGGKNFLKGNEKVRKCRHVFDAETRKTLKLCNACGLKLKRKQTRKVTTAKPVTDTDKQKYLEEGRAFGQHISELINDELAKQFFCPKFRGKPCQCLQTFMKSDMNDITEVKKRANLLLRYHKKAKELMEAGSQETKSSGKRSKEYDHFVLTNRDYLKSQLKLCEQAVQKVLGYSNNFLYKSKGDVGKRITIKPTTGSEKLNIAIFDIVPVHNGQCRDPNCKKQVATIIEQDLRNWREKSQSGQTSRHSIIKEMVERSSWQLCDQFIQMVTGAGISCIARVRREMRRDKEEVTGTDEEQKLQCSEH